MTDELKTAIDDWNAQVDGVAARLISRGVRPADAMRQAEDFVATERRTRVMKVMREES